MNRYLMKRTIETNYKHNIRY